ncbi:SMI1/KNR4 family protein [Virgibacillus pantothenticus]|uniref:Knr4/Smi1-like domain-containing protein n=1 Tax=Virgibacillus pantothenticus TaxID=1473 RepID=A0A0L0QQ13_VIRPA|nr:SMI1/KNR4 family protein [Virgibacillus pantothenticus]KNE20710.1 hypothetical protein AFK71_20485 [Virgibacillus pantothenticus]MED3737537.1 SMI1/KNR4 family protein [Virgibacillus pantothenticus]QTY17522.1 SMI1/KNR4 family protein [Virgibacillus pantothenticus]SIT04205.1 SMI1-KNR4 cell-wall [Virgibacillus pantothenticus]
MIEIEASNVKFDKAEFSDFENKLGTNLPVDYVSFLKEKNGGTPEPNILELSTGEINSISITDFFGVKLEEINDLNSQYNIYKGRIPRNNIPICRVEGGNIVCLNVEDKTISFWDHDIELIKEELKPRNPLIYIAESFNDFLESIKPYNTEDEMDDYKVKNVWIDPEFLKEIKSDSN